jgi:hypothetical protein
MSIYDLKADNLVKLLNRLSLLDNQDQDRIISVVDALNFASKKAKKAVSADTSLSNEAGFAVLSPKCAEWS